MENTNKQVTFGHILTILAVIIIPLIVWGVMVENRFQAVIENTKDILEMRADIKEWKQDNNANFQKLYDVMVEIKLQLENKQNRE